MDQSTCTVDNCDRTVKNKRLQLCAPHYKRFWRTGDTQAHIPIAPERKPVTAVIDYEDGTRQCQECGQRLPLQDFHNDKRSPKGKRKSCKTCRVARETARYNADPEAARARMSAYRAANPEIVRERDNQRYERDKTKRVALAVKHAHIRRARINNQKVDRGISVPAVRKRDGDRCYYCACKMIFKSFPRAQRKDNQATLEHLTPISRGGSHTWDNVVLACWRCNISKGAREHGFWATA